MNAPSPSHSGGPPIGQAELNRIAELLRSDSGIEIPAGKESLVQARLSRRLRALGLASYADYCDYVSSPSGKAERAEMLSALTTNVTKFFREPHHFDDLRHRIASGLITKANSGQTVRIWSAGCSSGEEPYSIAMCLHQLAPEPAQRNIRILGTDIDPHIIAKAKRGTYPAAALNGLDAELRNSFFNPAGHEMITIDPRIRDMVTFNRLNLHSSWPMRQKFDLILCRNVMIYFNKSAENRIWERMVQILNPGGFIMVGHSERIPTEQISDLHLDGVTTYQKRPTNT